MSFLINRTPTGRIISLLAEIKYLKALFGAENFSLSQMKFNHDLETNQLHFFPLAKRHEKIGLYDPYLENPLSRAGFHLTQSVQYDSQKSKSVSECMNALEALGWADRVDSGQNKLTTIGLEVADLEYTDKEFFDILRKSLLGYGPFLGFLYKCHSVRLSNRSGVVKKSDIEIGYTNTNETYLDNGRRVPLSVGSQKDSIVRTRGALFAWALTAGFLWPEDVEKGSSKNWQINALELIKNKKWSWGKFKILIPVNFFDTKHFVNEPLEYRAMTKSTKALRERGQSEIRRVSMMCENKVSNRRFAIVYCLSLCSLMDKKLDYPKLIIELLKHEDYFVVNKREFISIMEKEKDIAIVSGIPFRQAGQFLIPLSKINIKILTKNSPIEIVKILNNVIKTVSK